MLIKGLIVWSSRGVVGQIMVAWILYGASASLGRCGAGSIHCFVVVVVLDNAAAVEFWLIGWNPCE